MMNAMNAMNCVDAINMMNTMNTVGLGKLENALRSPQYIQVRRRIFRQLIESLIFEGIIEAQEENLSDGLSEFRIGGLNQDGRSVAYLCQGKRKLSFGRIRLSCEPVKRVLATRVEEAKCIATFFAEIAPSFREAPKQVATFIHEIHQTLIKDTLAQVKRQESDLFSEYRNYDDLEGDVMDGHPYHPCYKSRVGFDLVDNEAYAPDFKPRIKFIWLAIHKEDAKLFLSKTVNYTEFIRNEIGEELFENFNNILKKYSAPPENYFFVPVHPWQWKEKICSLFFQQIQNGRIIILGEGKDEYTPQQSIRTLANRSHSEKAYVKVPLSIINTSAIRTLGSHHVENAPLVSDWLESILVHDRYLREQAKVIFLKEVVGLTFNEQHLPALLQQEAYGTLAVIWRESIYPFLTSEEEAIPFTAICHINSDGVPFIHSWVTQFGLEKWLRELLQVAVLPLIHLLYTHGIAMESHAQNMVLVHAKGVPSRVALKDFPGGIRYYTDQGFNEHSMPTFMGTSHYHSNHSSSMATKKAFEVRDYLLDGFFQINLGEIAMFLEEQYGFNEHSFWGLVAEVIQSYQNECSHQKGRFQLFDLFEETIEIGQLTIRRLCGEGAKRDHDVKNPLFFFKREEF
jgi:siderophore synthetase component